MHHLFYAEIFETLMLLAFGSAWPLSIYKSYKSRTSKGKSIQFLFVIFLGYLAGITFQMIAEPGAYFVIAIFFLNAFMVLTDIGLYFRNVALDKQRLFEEQPVVAIDDEVDDVVTAGDAV